MHTCTIYMQTTARQISLICVHVDCTAINNRVNNIHSLPSGPCIQWGGGGAIAPVCTPLATGLYSITSNYEVTAAIIVISSNKPRPQSVRKTIAMECNAVNQCYDNTPLKRPNTPPLLGVAPNTLTQPANTPRCQLNTLVCCHNTPWAVTPLKPNTPRAFFFNSVE